MSKKKIFVQRIFKALFPPKPNCAFRAEAKPVRRFCLYAIPAPAEIFIIYDRIPNLVELTQFFFVIVSTDRRTLRERDKNKKVLRKARKAFEKKLYKKKVKKNPKALYRYINAKKRNNPNYKA